MALAETPCDICGSPYTHAPLTPYSISIQDGLSVEYRTGKAGATDVTWSPWAVGQLVVQKYIGLFKGRDAKKNGLPAIIAIKGISWAEYGPGDYTSDVWLVEGYYMQVRETAAGNLAPQAIVDAVKAKGFRL